MSITTYGKFIETSTNDVVKSNVFIEATGFNHTDFYLQTTVTKGDGTKTKLQTDLSEKSGVLGSKGLARRITAHMQDKTLPHANRDDWGQYDPQFGGPENTKYEFVGGGTLEEFEKAVSVCDRCKADLDEATSFATASKLNFVRQLCKKIS